MTTDRTPKTFPGYDSNHPLIKLLETKYAGVISSGCHSADEDKVCILELDSEARGLKRTDSPMALDKPDVRPINDAYQSDEVRSFDMLRLGVALWSYPEWSLERRVKFAQLVSADAVEMFGNGLPPQKGDALLTLVVDKWIAAAEKSGA